MPLTPHILVVDDDVMIGEQLERLFTHSGYKVTSGTSFGIS